MSNFLKMVFFLYIFLMWSLPSFALSENNFPYRTVGRVGSCSTILLSKRVALLSAHCLLDSKKNLKPEAHRFIIRGQPIDIELAVIGSLKVSEDNTDDRLIIKDWAFIILKESRFINDTVYLPLSDKYFSTSDTYQENKQKEIVSLHFLGLDEGSHLILESCKVYNKEGSDLLFTTCQETVGKNSGFLMVNGFTISALISMNVRDDELDSSWPPDVKSIAIPVSETMIKVYEIVDYLVKIQPSLTSQNLYSILTDTEYVEGVENLKLNVVSIEYDPQTGEPRALLQNLRPLKIIERATNRRIRHQSYEQTRPGLFKNK